MASVATPQRRGPEPPKSQRITLVQTVVTRRVHENLATARRAIGQARNEGAGWILFPEGFLSGYYTGFKQDEVASAFAELQRLCGENHIIGLISTGWKETGKTYNQIRIVDAEGHLAGQYAKTCLCYGEADWTAGGFPLVHTVGGLKVGTLICNDLWVTPGFSDGPNPHLSRLVARTGAQVIFHAVNSGNDQRFRAYHESNLTVRAAEANCPIVVVNAYSPPAINASSGVVGTQFQYVSSLPRDRETIQTVEFTPAQRER